MCKLEKPWMGLLENLCQYMYAMGKEAFGGKATPHVSNVTVDRSDARIWGLR
jgi:hypothetical protein